MNKEHNVAFPQKLLPAAAHALEAQVYRLTKKNSFSKPSLPFRYRPKSKCIRGSSKSIGLSFKLRVSVVHRLHFLAENVQPMDIDFLALKNYLQRKSFFRRPSSQTKSSL